MGPHLASAQGSEAELDALIDVTVVDIGPIRRLNGGYSGASV